MSDPVEQQIRDAFLDRLRTIRVGAGFYTDLGEAILDRRIIRDEVAEANLPAATAFAGNEVVRDGCAGGTYGSALEVWVQAVFGPGPEGDLELASSRIKADVKKAILTEPTLSDGITSLVDDVEWGGASKDFDEFAVTGLGVVNLLFVAVFGWTPNAA